MIETFLIVIISIWAATIVTGFAIGFVRGIRNARKKKLIIIDRKDSDKSWLN